MLNPKAITRFALLAVAVYAVLTWLFPAYERGYAAWFRVVGNAAFSRFWFWPQAGVRFIDLKSPTVREEISGVVAPARLKPSYRVPRAEGVQDTLLVLMKRKPSPAFGTLRTSSRVMGYVPTAVLAALILATPIRWWRRLWMLVLGCVLVHIFIVVRLTVLVVNNGFAAPKPYALFHPGRFATDLLRRLDEVLADNPTFSYLVPVFLWVIAWAGLELWSALGAKRTASSKQAR